MSQKKKILLVDDDEDILQQLTVTLKDEGYELLTAQGQQEAEETLLSVKPDLAILDLMMEEKDSGFVLCHEIKRMYPDTPVIILTAVTAATGLSFAARSEEERSWVKADLLMDKPVSPEQLRNQVKHLLSLKG